MKRSTLICLLALATITTTLFSCKKGSDEDTDVTQTNLLVGKWFVMQDTVAQYKNGTFTSNASAVSRTTADLNVYYKFNDDATGVKGIDAQATAPYIYSLSGTSLTFNIMSHTEYTGLGSPKLVGASTVVSTIQSLTTTKLKILFDAFTADGSGNVFRTTEVVYMNKQ